MTDTNFVDTTVLDYTSASDVLPFCVYYWINPKESVYRSYLSGPSIIKTKNGFKYECAKPNSLDPYGKWTLGFTFYAINPMLRPIPTGMALFCAERKNKFPWDTRTVRLVYDTHLINEKCLYFIAYTKPTPWTKPLFVHIQGSLDFPISAFPSWDPNPPVEQGGKYIQVDSKEILTQPIHKWVGDPADQERVEEVGFREGITKSAWRHALVFPFYVLSPELFGPEYEKIKFVCHNAYCFPYNPNNDYVDKISVSINERLHGSKPTPRTLTECTIRCNQLVPDELGGGHPFDMTSMIADKLEKMSVDSPDISVRISRISPIIIAILITVLAACLGVLVYISIRNK